MLDSPDVTELLAKVRIGDTRAEGDLLQLVYGHLRQRARSLLSRETPNSAGGSSTLVHDVYLKLFRSKSPLNCIDRTHFYVVACRAMRRVIIDKVRQKRAHRRGGGQVNLSLDDGGSQTRPSGTSVEQVIAIGEVCDRLAATKPLLEQIIQLHFFGGMTIAEIADVLELSQSTIENRLRLAKAFLHRELTRSPNQRLGNP